MQRFLKTEKQRELYAMLKDIWDDYDFLIGTMNELRTVSKQQKMIDFLRTTQTRDTDIIIPKSLEIDASEPD